MATTLTLKNIPDAVHERLKTAALAHQRSLNSEAVPGESLARARELRATLPKERVMVEEIDAIKREARS